jgi:hypothetical protein
MVSQGIVSQHQCFKGRQQRQGKGHCSIQSIIGQPQSKQGRQRTQRRWNRPRQEIDRKSKYSESVNAPKVEGMVPVKAFMHKNNDCSAVRAPNCDGMAPVKRFTAKFMLANLSRCPMRTEWSRSKHSSKKRVFSSRPSNAAPVTRESSPPSFRRTMKIRGRSSRSIRPNRRKCCPAQSFPAATRPPNPPCYCT